MEAPAPADFLRERKRMVERQLIGRGIRSARVLEAMGAVERERFVPPELAACAYEDSPLPIAESQTISQPYVVALMIEALDLRDGDRVLEIGTGSGYAAAVLAHLAREVYTVERIGSLAGKSADILQRLGLGNVHVRHADGTLGWSEHAPYEGIIVAAGGPYVPEALEAELTVGGRLVIPVGRERLQSLTRVVRIGPAEYTSETLADVSFVPLYGVQGWTPTPNPSRP